MVAIILARPQMGENIGATARVMMNCGLTDLRLVAPRDGWPNERAEAISSGALEHMPPVKVYETLNEAIEDLHIVYATTARAREMVKPVLSPEQAAKDSFDRENNKQQKTGIVFGAERTGMLNDEITACQSIISIPTNAEFASLNLATAVTIITYEWLRVSVANNAANPVSTETPGKDSSPPALQKDIEGFLSRLESELKDNHFFRDEGLEPVMKRNVRNIFTRAEITDQELRTLHGIVSALIGNKSRKREK